MSPLIEIALFFFLSIALWSWRGLLIAIGISVFYLVLLWQTGRLIDKKDEPPK